MDEEKKNNTDFGTDDENIVGGQAPLHPYVIPIAILLAGAMIAGAVALTNSNRNKEVKPDTAAVAQAVPDLTAAIAGAPALGNPAAPVTIVEFADFQCPFCAAVEGVENQVSASLKARDPSWQPAIRGIIKNYVAAGKVKLVYKDFPFLGPESEWASEAAACAGEQGKFWEFRDYLYSHQNGENQGAFSKDNLKHFALTLGLDGNKFNACLDADKFLAAVRKSKADGTALGVNGTPTSFVNGTALTGAVSYQQFASAIEAELKKSK